MLPAVPVASAVALPFAFVAIVLSVRFRPLQPTLSAAAQANTRRPLTFMWAPPPMSSMIRTNAIRVANRGTSCVLSSWFCDDENGITPIGGRRPASAVPADADGTRRGVRRHRHEPAVHRAAVFLRPARDSG